MTAPDPGRLPPLHARTVPLDYGPDALQFDGGPTAMYDRPGLTLVGWGTARLVRADAAAEALAAIDSDDPLRCPGSGPLALGALPFEEAMSGHLVVPRFTMGISRDADGMTRRWATAVGPDDAALPGTDELFEAVLWQYGTTPDVTGGAVPGGDGRDHDPVVRRLPRAGGAGGAGDAGAGSVAAQGRAARGPSPWSSTARSRSPPCCAACGRPNPPAPCSPCRSTTARSSAPPPSSSWPATVAASRAIHSPGR